MSNKQNATIVRRVLEEAFNHNGDLSVIDELVAEDVVDHTQPPHLQQGRESLKQVALAWRSAFPDLKATADDILVDGDLVVTRWTGSGTFLGELMGIAPTGKKGTLSGISFQRVRDGRMVERWGDNDQAGLFVQVGLMPAPSNA